MRNRNENQKTISGLTVATEKIVKPNDFERDEIAFSFGLGIEFFINHACDNIPDCLKLEMCENIAGADTYPILLMTIDVAAQNQENHDIRRLKDFAKIETRFKKERKRYTLD